MQAYIMAHDLGTSGNKATLYSLDGKLAASSVRGYRTIYPGTGQVEQDAEAWWRAVCASSRELMDTSGVDPRQVLCVSFSGQLMGCLPVDKQGTPLRPAIIWADTRAIAQETRMKQALGASAFYHITDHRPSASYTAAKWLWIREHEPDVARQTHKLLQAKDFIVQRMTGRFVTDYSDASGTNLLDIRAKQWSDTLLRELNIAQALLPELHSSAWIAGAMQPRPAAACGLLPVTPVALGGGDGSCACVGAGVVAPGSAYHVLGSSSWISTVSREPVFDSAMRTFNWVHLNPDLYAPCGTMQAAGTSYQWLRELLQADYTLMNQEAASSSPGAGGVLFLPYLLGERLPRWDAEVRGAFLGLSQTTSRGDMARAVMEGVAMNLKIILDVLTEHIAIDSLNVIGGGAVTPVWLQILADVWQRRLTLLSDPRQATSLGAAICGGIAIGALDSWETALQWNRPQGTVTPSPQAADYQALFPAFDKAYQSLRDVNHQLYRFRTGKEQRS